MDDTHNILDNQEDGQIVAAIDGGVPARPNQTVAASRHLSSSTAKGEYTPRVMQGSQFVLVCPFSNLSLFISCRRDKWLGLA